MEELKKTAKVAREKYHLRTRIARTIIVNPPPSQGEFKVLCNLAEIGPTNAYQLSDKKRKTGKSYSFVFNSLKELAKLGMVELKGKAKTEKGTHSSIYDLTLKGVFFILHQELKQGTMPKSSSIYNIMEKYKSLLPLVFGKWAHFRKMKVEKVALFRLKLVVDTYVRDSSALEKGTGIVPWMDSDEQICWFFYFQLNHFKFSEQWLSALKGDIEVRMYVTSEMRSYQERLRKQEKIIGENLLFLET